MRLTTSWISSPLLTCSVVTLEILLTLPLLFRSPSVWTAGALFLHGLVFSSGCDRVISVSHQVINLWGLTVFIPVFGSCDLKVIHLVCLICSDRK